MFSFSLKKLLFLLAIAVFLLAAVVSVIKIIKWQKVLVDMEAVRVAMEASRVECLENVSKMNEEQIIEEINTITFATTSFAEESRNINKKASDYFFCNFDNSDKSEETYQRFQALVRNLKVPPECTQSLLQDLAKYYSLPAFTESFSWELALGDLTEICPGKLTLVCLNADRTNNSDLDWCKNICSLLDQYAKDKDKLEREILGFKNWNNDPLMAEKQYKWRSGVAYRFGGREAALKVCNNLNVEQKEKCILRADKMGAEKEKIDSCEKAPQELANLICQFSVR